MRASEVKTPESLGWVDRSQIRDVMDYLQSLKKNGQRGQTSKEIVFSFWGFISEPAVLKQLCRLKKWGLVEEVRLKYKGGKEIILYEAAQEQ